MADVRWWCQPTPIGEVGVVMGDAGVLEISLPGSDLQPPVGAREERSFALARQLDEYFDGARRRIDVDVDLSSVTGPFRRIVLETLRREVPYGETVTYGELASLAGRPRAARAVGTAMASNPVPLVVPCHRVVASDGLGGYAGRGGRLDLKRALLALEGVRVP